MDHSVMCPQTFYLSFHITYHWSSLSSIYPLIPVNLPVVFPQTCQHHSHIHFHWRNLSPFQFLTLETLPVMSSLVFRVLCHLQWHWTNLSPIQILFFLMRKHMQLQLWYPSLHYHICLVLYLHCIQPQPHQFFPVLCHIFFIQFPVDHLLQSLNPPGCHHLNLQRNYLVIIDLLLP